MNILLILEFAESHRCSRNDVRINISLTDNVCLLRIDYQNFYHIKTIAYCSYNFRCVDEKLFGIHKP